MRKTTERHSPESVRTVEERVIDAMHRFAYQLVMEYARPTDRLLEIGFGEGYGSELVGSSVREYVGVEVDEEAVAHALRKYATSASTYLLYDGSTLPFADGAFDIVISFQVLEHVADTGRFLSETRRVTRPGRVALIVTPNRNHRLADGQRPWNRYHVREFNPAELETEMSDAFRVVEIFGIHGSPTMNAIEKSRVARARKLARLDPLGLRYVLPEAFDTRLRSLLRRGSSDRDLPTQSEIGIEHMYRSPVTATSLDLLAVGYA